MGQIEVILKWRKIFVLGAILLFPFTTSEDQISKYGTPLLNVNRIPIVHQSSIRNLTIFELVTLNQLQDFVGNSIEEAISDSFWTSTSFLKNLLDTSHWSLHKAKRKIEKSVIWRNNNRHIINQQPNQHLSYAFNLEIKGYDREECPVVIIPFGHWQTYRTYVGKIKSIPKASTNLKIYFSNVMKKILHQIKKRDSSECSQFTLISDMEHYSEWHTSGIKFFLDTINLFDRVYPGVLKIAYLINSSPYYLKVAKTYKSRIPWDIKRKSFIYTTDKTIWKEALLQNIDASQLAPRYGGTNFFLE